MTGHEILETAGLGSKQGTPYWNYNRLYNLYTLTQHICFNTEQVYMKVFYFFERNGMYSLFKYVGVFEKIMYYTATKASIRKPEINPYKLRKVN